MYKPLHHSTLEFIHILSHGGFSDHSHASHTSHDACIFHSHDFIPIVKKTIDFSTNHHLKNSPLKIQLVFESIPYNKLCSPKEILPYKKLYFQELLVPFLLIKKPFDPPELTLPNFELQYNYNKL